MRPDVGPASRLPEQAEFATASVRSGRERSPLFMLAWMLVLGGVVALGVSGPVKPEVPQDAGKAVAGAGAIDRATVADVTISRRFDPGFPSLVVVASSPTGPITLRATRNPTAVRVQGDFRLQQVATVRFTLQSADGGVAGVASVRIPEPIGEGNDHGPTPIIDVSLPIPIDLVNREVMVKATAFGPRGRLIDAAIVRIGPEA